MSSAKRTVTRVTSRSRAQSRVTSKAPCDTSSSDTSAPKDKTSAPKDKTSAQPPASSVQSTTRSSRPQPRDIIYNMFLDRLNEAARECDYNGDNVQQTLMTIARNLELGCCIVASRESKKLGIRGIVTPGSNDICTVAYETAASRIADLLRDPARELFIMLIHGDTRDEGSIARNVALRDMSQLCPSILREEREIVKLRLGQRIEVHESQLYECHKCHKKRTTFDEYQMRSSDEAPTLAIRCLECGNQWTQHG